MEKAIKVYFKEDGERIVEEIEFSFEELNDTYFWKDHIEGCRSGLVEEDWVGVGTVVYNENGHFIDSQPFRNLTPMEDQPSIRGPFLVIGKYSTVDHMLHGIPEGEHMAGLSYVDALINKILSLPEITTV